MTAGPESKVSSFNLVAPDGRVDANTMDLIAHQWAGRESVRGLKNDDF